MQANSELSCVHFYLRPLTAFRKTCLYIFIQDFFTEGVFGLCDLKKSILMQFKTFVAHLPEGMAEGLLGLATAAPGPQAVWSTSASWPWAPNKGPGTARTFPE